MSLLLKGEMEKSHKVHSCNNAVKYIEGCRSRENKKVLHGTRCPFSLNTEMSSILHRALFMRPARWFLKTNLCSAAVPSPESEASVPLCQNCTMACISLARPSYDYRNIMTGICMDTWRLRVSTCALSS